MENTITSSSITGSGASMKPLPDHFHKRGVCYHLLKREGRAVLLALRYECTCEAVGFDVGVVRQVHTPRVFVGKITHPYEAIPRDGDYGKTWWSHCTLETAKKRFADIQNLNKEF